MKKTIRLTESKLTNVVKKVLKEESLFNANKLLKLYVDRYLKGKIDFDGLYIIPHLNEDNKISWTIENPNDLSYSLYPIKVKIRETFNDFLRMIGVPFSEKTTEHMEIRQLYGSLVKLHNIENIYLSKKDGEKLKREIFKERKIKFSDYDTVYELTCQGFEYEVMAYHEEIRLEAYVKILELKNLKTDEILDRKDTEKLLEEIYESGDIRELSDNVLAIPSNILYNNERIFDQGEGYLITDCTFFDRLKRQYL